MMSNLGWTERPRFQVDWYPLIILVIYTGSVDKMMMRASALDIRIMPPTEIDFHVASCLLVKGVSHNHPIEFFNSTIHKPVNRSATNGNTPGQESNHLPSKVMAWLSSDLISYQQLTAIQLFGLLALMSMLVAVSYLVLVSSVLSSPCIHGC